METIWAERKLIVEYQVATCYDIRNGDTKLELSVTFIW